MDDNSQLKAVYQKRASEAEQRTAKLSDREKIRGGAPANQRPPQ
jgi:hypothetical protein